MIRRQLRARGIGFVFCVLSLNILPSEAQQPATSQPGESGVGVGDLQKAVQNPVASLIRVPVQNNSNFGIGPFDRTQNVVNIQPVIPIRASQNWNLIIRWIAPIIWQPAPGTINLEVFGIEENTPAYLAAQGVQQSAGVFGSGDMTPTLFLSPAKPGKVIWGAGQYLFCQPRPVRSWERASLAWGLRSSH